MAEKRYPSEALLNAAAVALSEGKLRNLRVGVGPEDMSQIMRAADRLRSLRSSKR